MEVLDILKEPGGGDFAGQYVALLFGSGPLADAIRVVLAFLVFTGSLMLGWQILQGIVQSAYSGRILGEKWHQIWAPLRVVLGFGMLIPISTGAPSSIAEAYRHFIAVPAINLGNATLLAFMDAVVKDAQPISTSSVGGRDLAWVIAERELCAAVTNGVLENMASDPLPLSPVGGTEVTSGWWDKETSTAWSYGECGSLSFPKDEENAAFGQARDAATGVLVKDIRNGLATGMGQIYRTGGAALSDDATVKAMIDRARSEGKIVAYGLSEWLGTRAQAWDASVVAAASAVSRQVGQDHRAKIIESAKSQGFFAAGLYYNMLSQMSAMTVGLASQTATTTAPAVPEYAARPYEAAHAAMKQMLQWDRSEVSANDLAFAGDEGGDAFAKILAPLTRGFGEWLAKEEFSADPVGDMISFGHNSLVGAQAAIGAGVLAKTVGSSGPGKLLGADGGLDWIMQWATYAIMIALIVGSIHAYVLPMIPFIMVFMMCLSWMTLVLEGIVAIHIWAYSLIRMDGQEFFDTVQKPGLTLLFNVTLRPALSMLIFCGALVLLPFLLNVMNALIGTAYYGAQGGHIVGPVGMLIMVIIKTWLAWQICLRTFGLIPTIADRIGAWVGATNTQGYSEGSETNTMAAGMVALAARPAQGAMPAMSLGKREKDDKPDEKPKKGGEEEGGK